MKAKFDGKFRRLLAWTLLIGSLIVAPISAFTFAKEEPITVLFLSWFAITLTAIDMLYTAQVKEEGTNK